MRPFAEPGTHYHLEAGNNGKPTGVVCLSCGESYENIDEIPHGPHCRQRFVHSRWYAQAMASD